MVLALTWWGWSGLVVAAFAIVFLWARHAWRTAVQQQLLDYLARTTPEVRLVEVRVKGLIFKGPDPGAIEKHLPLEPIYRDLAAHGGLSAEAESARLAIFSAVAGAMRTAATEHQAGDPLRRAS